MVLVLSKSILCRAVVECSVSADVVFQVPLRSVFADALVYPTGCLADVRRVAVTREFHKLVDLLDELYP